MTVCVHTPVSLPQCVYVCVYVGGGGGSVRVCLILLKPCSEAVAPFDERAEGEDKHVINTGNCLAG